MLILSMTELIISIENLISSKPFDKNLPKVSSVKLSLGAELLFI